MTTFSKKTLTGALGALALAATMAASASPAEAKWGRNAALFGGLAGGAIIAGTIASNAYAAPVYGHGPAYVSSCWREKRPVTNRWGEIVGYRSVRFCD